MPRKVKKAGKRKRRTRQNLEVVRVVGSPVPDKIITNMRYGYSIQSSAGAIGAVDQNLIQLNSTYDPDGTFVGHQPYGRDQYVILYNRYRVISATIHLTYSVTGNVSSRFLVILIPSNDATLFTSMTLALENPYGISFCPTISKPVHIKKKYMINKIAGVTSQVLRSDDRFQAQADADPAEAVLLHQVIFDATTGSDTNDINISGYIDYEVEWFDRLQIAQS